MPIEISEDVLQNDEFSMVTDSNGDLVLEHKPTGGQFKFDSTNNAWTPVQGLAMAGGDIDSAGNVDVGQSLVTQDLTVNGSVTGLNSDLTETRAFLSASSSANPVPFDSVSYDADNNFDTGTHEYTVPSNGTYQYTLQIRDNSNNGRQSFQIERNGVDITTLRYVANGNFQTFPTTDVRKLNAGDTLEVSNAQGGSVEQGEKFTFFQIRRIS
jgi:hypothetical protein